MFYFLPDEGSLRIPVSENVNAFATVNSSGYVCMYVVQYDINITIKYNKARGGKGGGSY